jgi:hypothetical protein
MELGRDVQGLGRWRGKVHTSEEWISEVSGKVYRVHPASPMRVSGRFLSYDVQSLSKEWSNLLNKAWHILCVKSSENKYKW